MFKRAQPQTLEFSELAATAMSEAVPAERDAGPGLNAGTVDYLSDCKGEPPWLRKHRLDALRAFVGSDQPLRWAPSPLSEIHLEKREHG